MTRKPVWEQSSHLGQEQDKGDDDQDDQKYAERSNHLLSNQDSSS